MINVKDLVKVYGDRTVLKDVTFSINKGEIVGLLGLNGAGKSTTMNIITGCLAATSGEVTINGISMDEDSNTIKKEIGYLPEIPPLYVDMTIKEYLIFVYRIKKVKENLEEHINYVCDKAGILTMQKRLIKNLSKGYKQRVGIAATLIGNPNILIFDEPTVGLDPTQIIEIRNLIIEMGKEHTIILSSHILSEVQSVCNRIIILKDGELVADGTPDRLKNEFLSRKICTIEVKGDQGTIYSLLEQVEGVFECVLIEQVKPLVFKYELLFDGADSTIEAIFNTCAFSKLPIYSLMSNTGTLEDVFLNLTNQSSESEERS
jgi:ABC-2 type transport system ATP-binding protein